MNLVHAPFSSEVHGEWTVVRDATPFSATTVHRSHRIEAFDPPSLTLHPSAAMMALEIARDGITSIFDNYEVDVSEHFLALEAALNAALYADDPESPDGP